MDARPHGARHRRRRARRRAGDDRLGDRRLFARHGAGCRRARSRPGRRGAHGRRRSSAPAARAVPVIADVTDDEDCARAVSEAREALGGLDTLVNNVAAWSPAELFDVEPDAVRRAARRSNLKTAWLMTRHADRGDAGRRRDRQHHLGGGASRRHDLRAGQGRARVDDRRRRLPARRARDQDQRGRTRRAVDSGVADNLPTRRASRAAGCRRSRPRATAGTPPRPSCSWPPIRPGGSRVRCWPSTAEDRLERPTRASSAAAQAGTKS